jgi:hypothetical protein
MQPTPWRGCGMCLWYRFADELGLRDAEMLIYRISGERRCYKLLALRRLA